MAPSSVSAATHAGTPSGPAALADPMLEHLVRRMEIELAALGDALRRRDSQGMESHADALQLALIGAMDASVHAAHEGKLPEALRMRLVRATGQLAAQRESLARATASLDRAMDVLMPQSTSSAYLARHFPHAPRSTGSLTA